MHGIIRIKTQEQINSYIRIRNRILTLWHNKCNEELTPETCFHDLVNEDKYDVLSFCFGSVAFHDPPQFLSTSVCVCVYVCC